jgi:predicted RNase H-like nuclease (RuvC/YqgF family)
LARASFVNASANTTLAEMRAEYEKELSTLRTAVMRAEARIKQLETTVENKSKENAELIKLCDELIAKVEAP